MSTYWSDIYTKKEVLQGTDHVLIQDSDNNYAEIDAIKEYVEENSTVINSLSTWTYETLATGFVIGRKGKERIIYINGYASSSNIINGFCTLGISDFPKYNVSFMVAIEGVGNGLVSITTSGQGTLYSANMGSYLSGKCYGTISYQVA
jgi:hypothetical protein